jgi:predicted alpha/beta hydrolase family esterase
LGARILTVPGYTNSGPEHWQTHWEAEHANVRRVIQRDWDRPVRDEWVGALDRAVRAGRGPAVLVAHSLGCATVAHWLGGRDDSGPVVGALLVAPADVDQPGWPDEVIGFRPMPLAALPLESTVVAGRDDPWVSVARARTMAEAWGSRFVDAGAVGHLDSSSGLGAWPEGWRLLEELFARCGLPS